MRGRGTPPFPLEQLEPGDAADPELHAQIAARFVRGAAGSGKPDLLHQLQEQAVGFLIQGRYAEAGALFEFYLRRDPTDQSARNNLAFCLMPVQPELALHHLEALRLDAVENSTMTVFNLCTALAMLGRRGEALDRAEFHWQRGVAPMAVGAYLWRETADGLELFLASDVVLAFAELGSLLAESLELPDRSRRWDERILALRSPSA